MNVRANAAGLGLVLLSAIVLTTLLHAQGVFEVSVIAIVTFGVYAAGWLVGRADTQQRTYKRASAWDEERRVLKRDQREQRGLIDQIMKDQERRQALIKAHESMLSAEERHLDKKRLQ